MSSFWINIPIAVVIIISVVGIPLWLVIRHRETTSAHPGRGGLSRREHLRRQADSPEATPHSRPVIADPQANDRPPAG